MRHSFCVLALALVACGGAVRPEPQEDSPGGGGSRAAGGPSSSTGAAGSNVSPPGDVVTAPTNVRFVLEPTELTLGTDGVYASFTAAADPENRIDGSTSERIEAPPSTPSDSCGSLKTTRTQQASDGVYSGKRLRLRAKVKTENVRDLQGVSLAFSASTPAGDWIGTASGNTAMGTIKGSTDWQEVALVLDAPLGAAKLSASLYLCGGGTAWLGPMTVEQVDTSVALTPSTSGRSAP